MNYRSTLKDKEVIVVKVGTSSLTFPNGRLNFERIEHIVQVISKLKQDGKKVVLVSSGSIAAGTGKLGKTERPKTLPAKQAAAAVGQAVLLKIYQKLFAKHDQIIAQILLTYDVINDPVRRINVENTFFKLLEMGAVPIVNENDTVATEEIEIGDNDTLSALVATVCNADILFLMSDIDGMFTADPKKDPNAQRLSIIEKIDSSIEDSATGAGTNFGTGGMVTKIQAAKICCSKGVDMVIANADHPENIFKILAGQDKGTLFVGEKLKNTIR